MSKYEEFLAGERHEDIAAFIHESAATDLDALADHGTDVDEGMVVVVPGDSGRSAFQSVAGLDPMALASGARGTEGRVDDDLAGGDCPAAAESPDEPHHPDFVFAFSEAQNDEVEGLYNEGDVMHAYVVCACGETYSDKWLIDGA